MKAKHPTLPPQIVKVSNSFYQDSRDGRMIHISNLAKECPEKPVNTELKQDKEVKPHWTDNYENY